MGHSFMGEPEITGRGADDSLAESSFVSDDTDSEEEEEEEESIVDRSARAKEIDDEKDGYSDDDESEEEEEQDESIVERNAPPKEVAEEVNGYSNEDESEEDDDESASDEGEEDDDEEEEEEEDEEYEDSSFDQTTSTISEPTPPRRRTVSPRKSMARTPSKASPKKSLSKPLGESLRQAVVREEDESIEFIELVQGKTPAKKKRTLGKQKIVTEDDVSSAPIAGAEIRRMVRM